MAEIKYNVILYHDTAANWATDTTVYGENIFMYATDTGVMKKGDGEKTYADLDPIGGGGDVAWGAITNKPAVIAAGASKAAARTAIDAADVSHNHAIGNVTGLETALDGKAPASHNHAIANVTGLQAALDGKAATSHDHAVEADVDSGLEAAADIQALAIALSARIKALEDAPA